MDKYEGLEKFKPQIISFLNAGNFVERIYKMKMDFSHGGGFHQLEEKCYGSGKSAEFTLSCNTKGENGTALKRMESFWIPTKFFEISASSQEQYDKVRISEYGNDSDTFKGPILIRFRL